ncbi:zinc finger MYM-type protein 1-like [Rosa chinensis]|uniref:zinc finger MYM-type protein 1-like n=1 Tax=Rosa chinensis TaxID=74649 RepID=UPI000D08EC29|nr:zinc finger MYM-type protein 1-like [Rosa chinensis]
MKRYFKKVSRLEETSSSTKNNVDSESSKKDELEAILDNLPSDPARRKRILDYDPNIYGQVQRRYLLKGPCQPRNHEFPQTLISGTKRRFVPSWFDEHPEWLEHRIENDAVFCLCCYLFKPHHGDQGGGDKFTCKGFSNWKNKKGLQDHAGSLGSVHNQALLNCQALMNQKQHLESVISRQLESSKHNYYTLLNASIDCVRFLLRQGLAFRGHDESESSNNRGNFLELLEFLAEHNDSVKAVAFENAPRNVQLTSPVIQRDIINAAAVETLNAIMFDMGDAPFYILVDEARDHSVKVLMAVVLRYVDDKGQVIERFVGIQHVKSTDARSLKLAIDELFSRNGLSISNLRGQGYDGAMVNIVGASCKRRDLLREQQQNEVMEALHNDELLSGKRLNQETTLKRPGDTRWGSHYGTLLSIISMFSSTIKLSDMNDRFNKVNSELLVCVASLSPDNLFSAFDKQKLLRLAKFYLRDFSERDVLSLEDKLDIYLNEMRSNSEFSQLKGIGSLAKKLVEIGKHKTHAAVYKLLTLALVSGKSILSYEHCEESTS